MIATNIESRIRSFQRDHRGAIMVLGIFFACVMIGWMWMLVGLGDAMIWRDRSQEAADAVTYSSSAIQAKAMNLISFLNLVMLLITFIYMIMAFVWNIFDIFHTFLGSTDDGDCGPSSAGVRSTDCAIIGDVLSVIPYLEPIGIAIQNICGDDGSRWRQAADWVQEVQGTYTDHQGGLAAILGPYEKMMAMVMPPISSLEDLAGYGAPWAGEAVGVYAATQYTDWGKPRIGGNVGATLLPGTAGFGATKKWETGSKESPCGEGDGGSSGCSTSTPGTKCEAKDANSCKENQDTKDYREGLPVEITEEGMSDLCYIGAKFVLAPIGNLLNNIPLFGTIFNWILDGMASSVRGAYCEQDSTGYFEPFMHDALNLIPAANLRFVTWVQLNGGAKNSNGNGQQCPNNNWGVDSGGGSDGCGGGPDDCRGVYQIQKSDGTKFWHNRDVGGPHLVVEYAENGNDWFQNWSLVYGGNRPEQSEKLVGVAGMDSTQGGGVFSTVIPQDSETLGMFNMYVAQSEFYFDCNAKWDDPECNDDYTRASFELSWRARMRRVRGLSWGQDIFKYITGGSLGSSFNDAASSFFQVGNKGDSQSMLNGLGSFAANSITSGAFGDLKDKAFNYVGGAINPASMIPDIIH